MPPYKKILSTVFKATISFSGLFYIFWKVPIKETMTHWNTTMLPWVFLILLLTFLSMLIQANRWRGLLLEEGKKIRFRTFYAYIALGYFFNNLLPGGFGGDAVKTISFGKRFGQTAQSVAAIAVSRIMGLLAMFLCFFIALPIALSQYSIPNIYMVFIIACSIIALLSVFGFLFLDKIKIAETFTKKIPFILKLQNAFGTYRHHKKAFFLSGIDSIWLQLFSIFIHVSYFKAVGYSVDLWTITVFTTITVTLTMLPISINGIGIRENVQVSLYSAILGIPADIVLASTLIGYIPLLFQTIQGAAVFATLPKKSIQKNNSLK